jgi:hypothetical protein
MLETTRSWPEFTRTLGATLPFLDDGDTLIFSYEGSYAQCQMAEVWLHAEVVSNHHLPPEHQLSAEQEEQLRAMGWLPPDPPGNFNWHVKVPVPFPMPMSDDEAVRLAEMMVSALRDVYGIDRVDLLEEREFNALY